MKQDSAWPRNLPYGDPWQLTLEAEALGVSFAFIEEMDEGIFRDSNGNEMLRTKDPSQVHPFLLERACNIYIHKAPASLIEGAKAFLRNYAPDTKMGPAHKSITEDETEKGV